ncbi:MAG: substrate-binding domain-containing protein, partial [Pseudomonadota bacterium]|nr:substrate-binding domain-containing protein [Pseudomonadota bacterium]
MTPDDRDEGNELPIPARAARSVKEPSNGARLDQACDCLIDPIFHFNDIPYPVLLTGVPASRIEGIWPITRGMPRPDIGVTQLSFDQHRSVIERACNGAPAIPLFRPLESSVRHFLKTALPALAIVAGMSVNAQAAEATGAGASFVYPAMSKWSSDYNRATSNKINYQSIGSGGGIAQIKAGTVSFGSTDAPLSPKELGQFKLAQFPSVIGGVVPVVN